MGEVLKTVTVVQMDVKTTELIKVCLESKLQEAWDYGWAAEDVGRLISVLKTLGATFTEEDEVNYLGGKYYDDDGPPEDDIPF
jgi:hypothetical protein